MSILVIFSSSLVLLFALVVWSFYISDKREKCKRWFSFYVRSFEWYCLVWISCISHWMKKRVYGNFLHIKWVLCESLIFWGISVLAVKLLGFCEHLGICRTFPFSLKGRRILWGTKWRVFSHNPVLLSGFHCDLNQPVNSSCLTAVYIIYYQKFYFWSLAHFIAKHLKIQAVLPND